MTAGEQCDPPDGVHCDEDCLWICGDGVVQLGEDCDPPNGVTCDDDCQRIPTCGDGILDDGEDCDDGGETETCDDDCTVVACGDGNLNFVAGEECDDGNNDDGDGCSAACTTEGPLPECTIDFDSVCPTNAIVCGAVFQGDGYCATSWNTNCVNTQPYAFKVRDGYGTITFLGDVNTLSAVIGASDWADGGIEFYDADWNWIDAAQTDGNCTYDAPTTRTFTFASPVRLAEYQGMGGEEGAFWIDTIQINP